MYSWKIWYENSIVTGNTIEEWANSPSEGVVGIVQHKGLHKGYKSGNMFSSADWYWMLPSGEIENKSESTYTIDYWVPCPAPEEAITKKGKWTTDERMAEVVQAMTDEFKNG